MYSEPILCSKWFVVVSMVAIGEELPYVSKINNKKFKEKFIEIYQLWLKFKLNYQSLDKIKLHCERIWNISTTLKIGINSTFRYINDIKRRTWIT